MTISKADVSEWMNDITRQLKENDRPLIRSGLTDKEGSEELTMMFAFETEMPMSGGSYVINEAQEFFKDSDYGFEVSFNDNETVSEAIGADEMSVVEVRVYPTSEAEGFA